MKIVHTSDWHLGARLREEDRADEHRAFLDWLAALMAEERPDALVVAGDVFDVKAPSPQAQNLYYGFLARIVRDRLCRTVVVIAGNHDNPKFLAAPSELLENLGIAVVSSASGDPREGVVPVADESGRPGLVVAALPFLFDAELSNFGRGAVPEDAPRDDRIRAGWDLRVRAAVAAAKTSFPGVPVVAVAHCTLPGARFSDADSERCRRVGGLDSCDPAPFAGADYVALGHLHVPQAVRGAEAAMFYSGSPLRMSFDEAGCAKSVHVVEFGPAGAPPAVRTAEVPGAVPLLTLRGAPEDVKKRLAALVAADPAKRRFVRLQLENFSGRADFHWAETRAIAKESATLVLEEHDLRPFPGAASGLRVFAGRDLRGVSPREVAERKLRTSGMHHAEERIAALLEKFDEAAKEALS